MNLNRKYYSSIAILFIGFFLVKNELRIDGEFGFFEPIIFIFDWIIIAGILTYFYVKKQNKQEQIKYNISPIWTTILIVMLTIIANRITYYKLNCKDRLIAQSILKSTGQERRLQLKIDGNYYAQVNHTEWVSKKSGHFKIKKDTILLDKVITYNGDTEFGNIYLLNSIDNFLIPIVNHLKSRDSSEWLTIEKSDYNIK